MLWAEVVVVIGGDEDALRVAVIENGDGLCGREVCRVRVLYGARVDALRIAQPRANKVEVVNAVIEDFEPGCGGKKGPEMPWSKSACLDFDVVDFTEQATACQCGDSEVIGRVAQREVYCGGETLAPAKGANDASFLEGLTHGLLHEDGRAIGYIR